MWCALDMREIGMVELVMTDLLSPNMKVLLLIGTPRYIRVYLRSTIWSRAILGATNSDPYSAGSTVACLLEYQSVGVPLTMWRMAVTALPVTKSLLKNLCSRLG